MAVEHEIIVLDAYEIKEGVSLLNIRTVYNDDSIRELATSILTQGLLNPPIVMESEDTDGAPIFEVVCGHRRLRAVRYLESIADSLDENDAEFARELAASVPCFKFVGAAEDAESLNALENIEREDVDFVDESAWVDYMLTKRGRTQEALGNELHRSTSWVSHRVVFNQRAGDMLKAAVREKLIRPTTGYEMASKLSIEEQDRRVEKLRRNESIASELIDEDEEKAKRAKSAAARRPSKKKLEGMLARADDFAARHLDARNAHGAAMALRYALGMISEEEMTNVIEFINSAIADEADEQRRDSLYEDEE